MVGDDFEETPNLGELENQMINLTYMGEKSPDRADAAVWALTNLSQRKTVQIVGFFN